MDAPQISYSLAKYDVVLSPRGALVALPLQAKLQAPQNGNMKHHEPTEFC